MEGGLFHIEAESSVELCPTIIKKAKLIKDKHIYLAEKSYRQSLEGQAHFLLDA